MACLLVNLPLIYRASSRVPFSVLKYAMTLDGKYYALKKLTFYFILPNFL